MFPSCTRSKSRRLLKLYRRYARIGLFSDIHFQEKGLDTIIKTGTWITELFEKQKVEAVVCLGDVLNTREVVNVQAQSAAFEFFKTMHEKLNIPIHVVLGNHDMNLRSSRKISSLDGLSVHENKSSNMIFLHRELSMVNLLDQKVLVIPYHHDHQEIQQKIDNLRREYTPEQLSEIVVLGHLSVTGALQNSFMEYKGLLTAETFEPFKRTFSGHFHIHHSLPSRVTYIGSPLQFNFVDAGMDRGVVLYDFSSDKFELIVNPSGKTFIRLKEADLSDSNISVAGYHVMIDYDRVISPQNFHGTKTRLLERGALSVQHKSTLTELIKKKSTSSPSRKEISQDELIEQYVEDVYKNLRKKSAKKEYPMLSILSDENSRKKLVSLGKKLCKDLVRLELDSDSGATSSENSTEGIPQNNVQSNDQMKSFLGSIISLTMENFMSIQGELTLPMDRLSDGVWIIEGANGSGKSTIFEAIVWCHFGEFLRSGANLR